MKVLKRIIQAILLVIMLALIGGLIFGTFLTLVFIPLVYNLVVGELKPAEQDGKLMGALKGAKKALSQEKVKTSES